MGDRDGKMVRKSGKYSCTLTQLGIAWTVAQAGITFAVCGARKSEHSVQNAAAGDLNLEQQDIQRMRDDLGMGIN